MAWKNSNELLTRIAGTVASGGSGSYRRSQSITIFLLTPDFCPLFLLFFFRRQESGEERDHEQ